MVTFTTSPIYWKPLVPRITIKSLDNATTYYTYDPWTDLGSTTKAISCNVQLSQNHQGVFTVQIEDETGAISSNANLGARVIIECGKQSTQMTRLISGLIRQKGYSRGSDRKRIITLSGSSTAIRLNELITNQDVSARKLASDNITIDTTDPSFVADQLLLDQLATMTLEGTASAAGLTSRSDVKTFIPSLNVSFGELQDVCNIIEEQTNAEIFVDVQDQVQFRHQLQPFVAGKGFAIKNKFVSGTNIDNADDTLYLKGKSWDYTNSCLKSDGYSSRVYGILPAETVPSVREEIGFRAAATSTGDITPPSPSSFEFAAKFKPPHSHWLPGDIIIIGGQFTERNSPPDSLPIDDQWPVNWTTRFRICRDSGGVPQNAGGIVANIDFPPDLFPSPPPIYHAAVAHPHLEGFVVMNNQYFYDSSNVRIDSFDLDTTQFYWLIASDDNIPVTGFQGHFGGRFQWAQSLDPGTGSLKLFPNGAASLSTDSAGGAGWNFQVLSQKFCFALPRRRSQAFECADPKAIAAIGSGIGTGGNRIESTLTNIPSSVKTKESMQKYLVNQLYYMARPRSNWSMSTVTAPNVPIMPGDPIMISDSVLGFSTAGSQAVMTTCGDMTYSWQIGQYQAPTILSIQPVSNPTRYK